jgi:inhibitor of KinA sporulation pathway (predicted exonuclease)
MSDSSCGVPSTSQVNEDQGYEYLVVIDFEATCDNGASPTISLSRNNQEMIEFPFVLVHVDTPSEKDNTQSAHVLHSEQHYVLPEYSSQLTPFCTELTGITDETLKEHGKPLWKVIKHFDKFVEEHLKDKKFCIIADGEWDLRCLLQRESKNKNIPLKPHYYKFFDLRKEFKKCFPHTHVRGLSSMVEISGVNFVGRHHCGIDDCMTIVEIINFLLRNGHRFITPCEIDQCYDPFRDLSFKNFYQPPPIYNTPPQMTPMFVYAPYPHYAYAQNNYYNAYMGAYPLPPKQRKRPSKGKRRHKNPAPKAVLPVPQIVQAVSNSDRSL